MVFCPSCGQSLEQYMTFCWKCGARNQSAGAPPLQPALGSVEFIVCPMCNGVGTMPMIGGPCQACGGSGRVPVDSSPQQTPAAQVGQQYQQTGQRRVEVRASGTGMPATHYVKVEGYGTPAPSPPAQIVMAVPHAVPAVVVQAPGFAPAAQSDTIQCAFCDGEGNHPMRLSEKCPVCHATGKVTITKPYTKCKHCDGEGNEPYRLGTPCSACGGKGYQTIG